MEDHGISLNKHCPCIQTKCRIRGNCVLCVQAHLDHKRHIPECFQNVLRDKVCALAEMMELKTGKARPESSFWAGHGGERRLKECLRRHGR